MPPGFCFSLSVLSVLRFTRRHTLFAATVSALLSLVALWLCFQHFRWIHPGQGIEPLEFFCWLSAASWITTLAGLRDRHFALAVSPILLVFVHTTGGLCGIITGMALNVPIPRRKTSVPKETYGITRLPWRSYRA